MYVTLITPENHHHFHRELEAIFKLRHKVFNEDLGWNLPHVEGQEFDKFDAHSLHFFVRGTDNEIIGSWRLMPTTKPYLTAEAFPELLEEIGIVSDPSVWDLSRGCIDREKIGPDKKLRREVIASLISSIYEFGIMNGIAEFLSVQNRITTIIANRALGDPVWQSQTINAGITDATCYSYAPSLERLYALRTQYRLASPILSQFQITELQAAA